MVYKNSQAFIEGVLTTLVIGGLKSKIRPIQSSCFRGGLPVGQVPFSGWMTPPCFPSIGAVKSFGNYINKY